MRSIALDVHRDFCEVAIKEGTKLRSAGRIKSNLWGAQTRSPSRERLSDWRFAQRAR